MTTAELTDEQREQRRTRARDLIEARLTETWPAWRRPGRKPNLALAADIALDSLGDLAAEILVDGTMLRALTFRDGVATLELGEATEMVRIFAAGMRGVLDGHGASNYVEMEMTDGATGQGYTVTVQRRECPTPHQFRQQAEAKVTELEARLAELAAPARRILGTTEQAQPATSIRDRIRRAVCEAEGFAWDTDMLEPDEYGEVADAVLAVLPDSTTEQTCPECGTSGACNGGPCPLGTTEQADTVAAPAADRAAVLREAADALAVLEAEAWDGADSDEWIGRATGVGNAKAELRRLADEAQQPTPAPAEETK